jgi:acetyl esterase
MFPKEQFPSLENEIDLETVTIKGVDDNDIELMIRRPKNSDNQKLPCICHVHGGGMVMLSAKDAIFVHIASALAARGAIVVQIEFRNAAGKSGNHPFPAGLNDCVSAIEWVAEHLNYSALLMYGDSGGANLSIASALKLKQDNKSNAQLDGIIAFCPYISNAYHINPKQGQLASLVENDDYIFKSSVTAIMASIYTLDEKDQRNPLAWPLHATMEQLQGLPPHLISLNELDPMRDEGKAFHKKLVEAGVPSTCLIVAGTTHGADLLFPKVIPELFDASMRNVISFARSVAEKKE